MDTIFLSEVYERLLHQIRMNFDLQNYWFDFAESKQFCQELTIEIGHSEMLCVSLLYALFKLGPALLEWSMQKLVALGIHVDKRPVHIIYVNVVKLH